MNKKFNDTFLKRLLLVIGSVPYDLKEELYIKLLGDKKWHYYIFQSLYESKFHGFQLSEQMNNKKAKKIIDQLELELKNNGKLKEEYDKLISVL